MSEKEWKVGDLCLAEFNGQYREFKVVTLRTYDDITIASLHATTKFPDERITVRTLRSIDNIFPSPNSIQLEKTMGYTIVQILTLLIPLAALIGLIYAIFKPSVLDKDK